MGQGAVSFPPLTSEILDKIRQISATWKARGPGTRILTHSPADTSEGRAPGREGRLPLPPRGKEGLRQTLSGKTPDKTPVTDTNDGMANRAGREPETSLYDAVKAFLERLGFEVKGEVCGCDIVGVRADEPPVVVITELKMTLTLELVLQGVVRLRAADEVWLAVLGTRRGRDRDRRTRRDKAIRLEAAPAGSRS